MTKDVSVLKDDGKIVLVRIMRHKIDGMYSFVNLSKGHICPCKFKTIDDAIDDLERLKKDGKVIEYKII